MTVPTARRRELRTWPRYIIHRNARVLAHLANDVWCCEIKDISLGGAKLQFESPVPESPDLTIGHPDLAPLRAECLWRHTNVLGIRFDFSEDALNFISHCLRTMHDPTSPDSNRPSSN